MFINQPFEKQQLVVRRIGDESVQKLFVHFQKLFQSLYYSNYPSELQILNASNSINQKIHDKVYQNYDHQNHVAIIECLNNKY